MIHQLAHIALPGSFELPPASVVLKFILDMSDLPPRAACADLHIYITCQSADETDNDRVDDVYSNSGRSSSS